MPPKRASPEIPAPTPEPEARELAEEPEPVIVKKCFRVGGQVYFGECKAGTGENAGRFIRHGKGLQVHNGVSPNASQGRLAHETVVLRTYDGNFEDDLESGHGIAKWADGSSYDGPWSRGLMHGYGGRFVWADGTTYDGPWHMGQMSGSGGRLTYSDGNFDHGKFYRDCFRDGSQWVNTLGKRSRMEILDIMKGPGREVQEPPPPPVLQVGNCDRGGQAIASQMRAVLAAIEEQGVIPFFIGEQPQDPLRILTEAQVMDVTKHAVSLRNAVVTRRRHRDHYRLFGDPLRAALRSGAYYTLVFEDYDFDGQDVIYPDWYQRAPATRRPMLEVPEEWGLEKLFFEAASGPRRPTELVPEILHPRIFNGREMSRLFVPEVHAKSTQAQAKAPEPKKHGSVPNEAAHITACAFKGVGGTGHLYTLPVTPDEAGIRNVPHLRTALVAMAPLPLGLPREEVSPYVMGRFGHLVPLHRTAIVVLTHEIVETTPRL